MKASLKNRLSRWLSAGLAAVLVMGGIFGKDIKPIRAQAAADTDTRIVRLAGSDRFETSIAAAEELKNVLSADKFENIVVASGAGFADALAGSFLAAKKHAPVLLAADGPGGTVMSRMTGYIRENLAENGKVYVLGGTAAVSASFEEMMGEELAGSIVRLAGSNRYETNLKILEEAGLEDGDDILVCTGTSFPDSLSAAATGKAILLVQSTSLTDFQTAYLESLEGEHDYYIIGGEAAVSENVADALADLGAGSVKRLAGADRYRTSTAVAKEFFNMPVTLTLAYAQNFPDGLSAGPLAYACGSPLIITQNADSALSVAVGYAETHMINAGKLYVMGGESLISANTAGAVLSAAESVDVEVVKTEFTASEVKNAGDGYGQLLRAAGHDYDEKALLGKDGRLVFDYKITPMEAYSVDGEYVSLTTLNEHMAEFYDMYAESEVYPQLWHMTANGAEETELDTVTAYPLNDGIMIGFLQVKEEYWCRKPVIMDAKGKVIYTFPDSFNVSWVSGGNISSRYLEDDCGGSNVVAGYSDGLVACKTYRDGEVESASFYDTLGNRKLTIEGYSDTGLFSDGLVKVRSKQNGLWGYVDKKGREVIPCIYEAAGDFNDGAAWAVSEGRYGYIDKEGSVIVPFEYDEAYGAGSGLASVVKDGKGGLVNYRGEVIVPLEYDDITSFDGGAAYAVKDGCVEIIRLKAEA